MDHIQKQFFASKISVIGLFAFLSLILTIPIAVLLLQEKQIYQGRAQTESVPLNKEAKITPKAKMYGTIAGYVYMDENRNGEREANENSFSNVRVKISTMKSGEYPGQNFSEQTPAYTTDQNGYFSYKYLDISPNSSIVVKVDLPVGYKTINTNPVILSDLEKDEPDIVQFGLFKVRSTDISISPTVSQAPCKQRPACLDTAPRCLLAEPAGGWCPAPSVSPAQAKAKITPPVGKNSKDASPAGTAQLHLKGD